MFRAWVFSSVVWACLVVAATNPFEQFTKYRESNEMLLRATAAEVAARNTTETVEAGDLAETLSDIARLEAIKERAQENVDFSKKSLFYTVGFTVIPSLLLFLLGMGVRWVIAGFTVRRHRG